VILSLSAFALLVWLVIALAPWQPHRYRERIAAAAGPRDLGQVTVLIPARNEAEHIERTLAGLSRQGPGLAVVVIDDSSSDATAEMAELAGARFGSAAPENAAAYPLQITVVRGAALPKGWGGKLWALEQGLALARRRYTLLLDADIELSPYALPALLEQAESKDAELVSVMAKLHCETYWEKLLVPPFVFFFKLIYPFALVSNRRSSVAAAAGGCVLVATSALRQVGAFESIRDALIDDCSLAKLMKRQQLGLWLGVSDAVRSNRRYSRLDDFWRMVSRTAFTQLNYSILLLVLTSFLMVAIFGAPLIGLFAVGAPLAQGASLLAILCMCVVFAPTVRFYELRMAWMASLPLAAVLYFAMTWDSAFNYWRGIRAEWKSRSYEVPVK